MAKTNSLKQRKMDRAEDLYCIANELRRVIFVKGGHPDDIMAVATKALRIVRQIDNPILMSEHEGIKKAFKAG